MVELTLEERQRLVKLLASAPILSTESGRAETLVLAGLSDLVPHIDLTGPPLVAASRIVTHLSSYGRYTREHEALGLLLNLVATLTGKEQQDFLADLLLKHRMMVPVLPTPQVTTWMGPDTPASVEEKIITSNTLRPVHFLEQALTAARAVCHIEVRSGAKSWTGTGFLVAKDLLLTNEHVLPAADLLAGTRFLFNYEDDPAGRPRPIEYVEASGRLFLSDRTLDFAVVELAGAPGERWGRLDVAGSPPRPTERVNIIQHPGGQPKQIAMQSNFVEYVDEHVIQYVTATLPGSSGSPVLTDDWQVCAIHHAGGNLKEPASGNRYFRNEGLRMSAILERLPKNVFSRIG
ncbi:trypsin-like peptidase domain-containing protein [Streptomyces europaeiscabiei]|uniref:trypsin-like peptidase domain-containing protein n=1 Tax=Streptomyces europaeiscabiei TaxID=146819 RepID=UPI002E132FEC|nr:serine protease [Streptomyces europaeiscabiei]